jgi:hypothetical protein
MTDGEKIQAFLREQLELADHKADRLHSAYNACQHGPEKEGLEEMLHSAQAERDLLQGLLARQDSSRALALDTLILQELDQLKDQAARLSRGWRRGHATPPTYWEVENKRHFLSGLLRRYHAWEAGRAYYSDSVVRSSSSSGTPQVFVPQGSTYPWYISTPDEQEVQELSAPDDVPHLNALRDTIYRTLHQEGYPDNHLEITVQLDGWVLIKGYAHSEEDHDQIIASVCKVPLVREVLADIQVVPQAKCLPCSEYR